MNVTALRKNNHAMSLFNYNMNRLLDGIDRRKKSNQADEDVMQKNLTNVNEDGERTWTFKDED
jgi:hypothetical protein